MVYKKYLRKKGKLFGPYYYESYREGDKVKKRYIGDEKQYQRWLKGKGDIRKKDVEQQPKIKKLSGFLAIAVLIALIFVVFLQIGNFASILVSPSISLTGFSVDENVSDGASGSLLYGVYEEEEVVEEFDKEEVDLKIKNPTEFAGEVISKNKNKRMEFNTSNGEIRLYFDLLNYSEFVDEVEYIIVQEEIDKLEAEDVEPVIEIDIVIPVEDDEGEDEEESEDESVVENVTDEETDINITEVEEIDTNVTEEDEKEKKEKEEKEKKEKKEKEGEDEVIEEEVSEEEPAEEPVSITGNIIRGITGFFLKISGFAVEENDSNNETSMINEIPIINEETIAEIEENITFEDVQDKIDELQKEEIEIINEESIIEAEGFDIKVDDSNEEGYKWGYYVKLNSLNFMAKIDITSNESISVWDNNTVRIGNNLLSFADLIEEGYTVRIEIPVLEMNVDEESNEIEAESNINIIEEDEETEISGDLNISDVNISEENVTIEDVEINISEEIVEDEVNVSEEVEDEVEEEQEEAEEPEEEVEEEEIVEVDADAGITGNIIRGLTGLVIETTNLGGDIIIEDIEYNNTITIYIERDFTNSDYSVGDVVFLDPTLTIIISEQGYTGANVVQDGDYYHLDIDNSVEPYESLVSYWSFDVDLENIATTTHYDFGSGANDGTGVGTAVVNETDCVYGDCLYVDGNSDYVNIGKTMAEMGISTSNNFSLSVWFKTSVSGVQQYIINNYWYGFIFRVSNDNKLYIDNFYSSGNYKRTISTNTVSDGEWHHGFAILYADGSMPSLYLDGVKQTATASSGTVPGIADSGKDVLIGRRAGAADSYFNGLIDEVMVFNTSLTVDQILDIYNNASARFVSTGTLDLNQANVTSQYYDNMTVSSVFENNMDTNISIGLDYYSDSWNSVAAQNITASNDYVIGAIVNNVTFNYTFISGNGFYTPLLNDSIISANLTEDTTAPLIDFDATTDANASTKETADILVNLTTSDVNDHYAFADFDNDLVGWWRMDAIDGSGNPYDNSSYGKNGVIVGPAQTDAGYYGKGFEFDGDDYVAISDTVFPSGNSNRSFSMWFKAKGVGFAHNWLLGYGTWSQDDAFGISVMSSGQIRTLYHTTTSTTTETIDLDKWYNLVVTYDGINSRIYLNGSLLRTEGESLTTILGGTAYLGRAVASSTGNNWNGTLDEVLIFNRTLSATEILALYNASANSYENNYTGLADGDHTFTGYAVDKAGNVNNTDERTVTIDTTYPAPIITYPANASYSNYVTELNYTVSSASFCWHSIDSGVTNYTIVSAGTNWTGLSGNSSLGGGNIWTLYCNDSVNNINSTNVTFSIDNTNPLVSYAATTDANASTKATADILVNLTTSDTNDHYAFADFDNDLVLWMRMDDVDGSGNPYDNSSYGNNGTAVADAVQTDAGYYGKGFSFDGDGDYVDVSSDPSLNIIEELTISVWAKPKLAGDDYQRMVGRTTGGNGADGYALHLRPNGEFWMHINKTSIQVASGIDADTWHHFVGVANTTDKYLYLDGAEVDHETEASAFQSSVADLWIGSDSGLASREFNGSIDEVLIFNRSLNATEILALYNASATQYENNFTGLADGTHTFTGYAVDKAGNVNETDERTVTTQLVGPMSANRFEIQNSTGGIIAGFDDKGDAYFRGSVSESQSSLGFSSNSFVVQNSSGATVAYVNNTGGLFLLGTVTMASDLSGLTSGNLEFRNSTNNLVSFFDNAGNLKLKGGYLTSQSF